MNDIPGFPTRRAALQLLDAVLRRGQPLENALKNATQNLDKTEDRALAHAIASEVLRRAPDFDALIDSATRQRLPDDAKARMVIRMALAQVLVLGTPEHAAVSTALPLVDGGPRRLVHGVLGTLLRQKAKLPEVPTLLPDVAARWSHWGEDALNSASEALGQSPVIDLTLKHASQTDDWVARLGGESLAPGHVRLAGGAKVTELPGFSDGAWWVQNLAASLPARLLGAGEGRHILDLCAAPGGKTMQLAAQGWQVTSVERDGKRLERVRHNLTRTRLSVELIEADLMKWEPKAPVDAILLDAPCTATGIYARHPDVLHRIRPRNIGELAEIQARMLTRAAKWLKPGGTLIYATCSLEREEGEDVVARSVLPIKSIEEQELVAGLKPSPEGWMRVLPHQHLDGFFIARFTAQ